MNYFLAGFFLIRSVHGINSPHVLWVSQRAGVVLFTLADTQLCQASYWLIMKDVYNNFFISKKTLLFISLLSTMIAKEGQLIAGVLILQVKKYYQLLDKESHNL
ncbi:MAG: hypothetical protein WCS87_14965 [Methylococcaceae bacterium]